MSTAKPLGPAITSADGTAIPCWGWKTITVTTGSRVFKWRFLLAARAFTLIGGDFLANFYLAVDLKRMRLVYNEHQFLQLQELPRRAVFALYGVRQAVAAAVTQTSPTSSLYLTLHNRLLYLALHLHPLQLHLAAAGLYNRQWWRPLVRNTPPC
jgi:hypothetical protein